MKRFWEVFSAAIMALLVLAMIIVAALVFYLGASSYHSADGKHAYTFLDATALLFRNVYSVIFAPSQLSNQEHDILEFYGNSLVLLVSLLAVAYSIIAVAKKLAQVGELVPYEKFDLWYRAILRNIPLVEHFPRAHKFIEDVRERAYKNLAVKKMVHYYRTADRLVIISGNYSWLFDNRWSAQARASILRMLPHDVCLISYKPPHEVADFWKKYASMRNNKAIFEAMAFTSSSNQYNGSIVKTGDTSLYIYLYRHAHRSMRRSSVCAFHGDREAKTLVKLVEEELVRLYEAGLSDPSIVAQKNSLLNDPAYFG